MEQKKKCLMRASLFIFLFSSVIQLLSEAQQPFLGKHFVLVHGAGHGAWCWYKLVPLLKSSGHRVTILDLPDSDINPKQSGILPSISNYFLPLINFMAALPSGEKVILVGHSRGGVAISQAMEKFPHKISVAVFVAATMLGPSLNISTYNNQESYGWQQDSILDGRLIFDEGPNNPPTTFCLGHTYLASRLYQLSPIEDLTLANLLVQPVRLYSEEEISNGLMLSIENYGSVSRVYIIANEDNEVNKDLQLWMTKKNPPNEVEVIEGADHMIMMSKPKELWAHLQSIAKKYC